MKNKIFFASLIIFISCLMFIGASCGSGTKYEDGGMFVSLDEAENWQQIAFIRKENKKELNISEVSINNIYFDPTNNNIIWITTNSHGMFKTTNGGNNWEVTSLNSGLIATLAINPENTNIMYSAQNNNIIKSIDSGENWDIVYTETSGAAITNIRIDNYNKKNILATTSLGAIIKSVDYGNNWSVIYRVAENKYIKDMIIDPDDTRIIYIILTENGFQKSTDGGENWTDMTGILKPYYNAKKIDTFKIHDGKINTIYMSSAYGLLKSVDDGKSWKPIQTLVAVSSTTFKNLSVNPKNEDIMYFTIGKLIHKSTDGGENWKTIENFTSSRTISKLFINPETPEIIYAGTVAPEKKKKTPFGF